jgi:hypothetical protein
MPHADPARGRKNQQATLARDLRAHTERRQQITSRSSESDACVHLPREKSQHEAGQTANSALETGHEANPDAV